MNSYFDEFKKLMPHTSQIVAATSTELLGSLSKLEIRSNLSELVQTLHDDVYENYKKSQSQIGESLILSKLERGELTFELLDKFFVSLGNSRKSRAGTTFELILKELFQTYLGYPLDSQVQIDGAKPDFVLPSAKRFIDNPLDCILLTAKRTLRERWRQVITEANKSYLYFLAHLDDNVSQNQINEAQKHKVYLVTTSEIIERVGHYQRSTNVISFEDFLDRHLDPAMKRWGLSGHLEEYS